MAEARSGTLTDFEAAHGQLIHVSIDCCRYADRFRLTAVQRAALIALDIRPIVAIGAHPLVPFLANMHVERQRRG